MIYKCPSIMSYMQYYQTEAQLLANILSPIEP